MPVGTVREVLRLRARMTPKERETLMSLLVTGDAALVRELAAAADRGAAVAGAAAWAVRCSLLREHLLWASAYGGYSHRDARAAVIAELAGPAPTDSSFTCAGRV